MGAAGAPRGRRPGSSRPRGNVPWKIIQRQGRPGSRDAKAVPSSKLTSSGSPSLSPESIPTRRPVLYRGLGPRPRGPPAAVTVGSPAKPPVSKRNSLSPRLIPVDPAREKDALPLPKRDDDDRRHEKAARGDAGGWRQPGAFDQLYLVPRPKRTCTPPNAGMDGPGRDADGLRRSGEVPAREARPSGGARAAQGGGAPGPARGTT